MLLAAIPLAGTAAAADRLPVTASAVTAVSGSWSLTQTASHHACTIKLNPKEAPAGGLLLGVTASCRKAIKAMLPVATWSLTSAGRLELGDAGGTPLFSFKSQGDGVYTAPAGGDNTFTLTPLAPRYQGTARIRAVDTAITEIVSPRIDPALPAEAAGRYRVLRAAGAETGCILSLDLHKGPAPGLGLATLEAGCQDKGLLVFNPAGWHVEGGDRLFITARKGHSFGLTRENGGWIKDPTRGAPMQLVKQ